MNTKKVPVSRWNGKESIISNDDLARESLVSMDYNGSLVANLLATPTDLRELIWGHLNSEGYLLQSDSFEEGSFSSDLSESGAFQVSIKGPQTITIRRNANDIVTSSCGACNTDGLDDLIRDLPILDGDKTRIDFTLLHNSFDQMKKAQVGFESSGGMHAAGLISPNYQLLCVNEDIGRHNAVDKVIGNALIRGHELSQSTLLLSGRCGWDIVAKASRCGIKNIASIGACSSMAAETARLVGIRIISFLRKENAVVIGYNSTSRTASLEN